MTAIWNYLKINKKETILAPLFKMLEACFELFIPLVVADIIDIGIANRDSSYIISRGLLMIFFGVAGFILASIAQYFAAKSAIGVSSALRQELFYHISELNYERLDSVGTSAMITSMTSDINQVQNGVNQALRLLLRSPFIVVGAAVMACTINLSASIVFWIVIAVLILIVVFIIKITAPMNAAVQSKLEKVTRAFRENLLGARVVRAFNRQRYEKTLFDSAYDELYEGQIKAGSVSSLLNPLTFAVINLAIVVILYTGAINVSIGNMTQGEVIALYNYMSQILVELIKFANIVFMLSKAIACFKRIQGVLAIGPSLKGGELPLPSDRPVDIELKNVSFSYKSGSGKALENISCRIPAGAKVGIIGATASGKSTLVNLISRFYAHSSGEILLNGTPIEQYSLASLCEGISVVPQKAALFKGTVGSNLKWGKADSSEDECKNALRNASALGFIEEKGMGLDLPVAQNGRNFSGGQRQRLSIARALIKDSKLLILDDSYSALDYATEADIKNAVYSQKKDCTVLTVSQRVGSVYDCDMILVLDKGRLVGVGKHDELFSSCPVYNEICRSQHFGKESA